MITLNTRLTSDSKRHTDYGYQLISKFPGVIETSASSIVEIILWHYYMECSCRHMWKIILDETLYGNSPPCILYYIILYRAYVRICGVYYSWNVYIKILSCILLQPFPLSPPNFHSLFPLFLPSPTTLYNLPHSLIFYSLSSPPYCHILIPNDPIFSIPNYLPSPSIFPLQLLLYPSIFPLQLLFYPFISPLQLLLYPSIFSTITPSLPLHLLHYSMSSTFTSPLSDSKLLPSDTKLPPLDSKFHPSDSRLHPSDSKFHQTVSFIRQ